MAEIEPEEGQQGRRVPTGAIVAAGVAATLSAFAFRRARYRVRLAAHQAALEQLAKECGCGFIPARPETPEGPDFPVLEGTQRERRVRVDTEVGEGGLAHPLFTRATASHRAPVEGFVVIREETLLSRMADRFGLKDVQLGEPEFDARFEIASDLPDAARLLQPEIRDALMAAQFESVIIRAGEVSVRQRGPVVSLPELRDTLKLAIDMAEWLETLS